MVHTSGTVEEIDLFEELLKRSQIPNTESNRSVIANAFRQGWRNGMRHQRLAEIRAFQAKSPERASMLAATLELMKLPSDREARRYSVETKKIVRDTKKRLIWKFKASIAECTACRTLFGVIRNK
jgi:hypothetical protein